MGGAPLLLFRSVRGGVFESLLLLMVSAGIGSRQLCVDQVVALVLVLHSGVRVQRLPLARLFLLRVQNLDAVGQLSCSIVLVMLSLRLAELLLALRDGVL